MSEARAGECRGAKPAGGMIDSRKALEATTVSRRGVLRFGLRSGGSNDGIVSDLGGDQRVVPAHRAGASRADWTRVALRTGDPGCGKHRVGRELSPAGTFVFIPRREHRIHSGVHGGGGGFAPSSKD